MNYYSVTIYIKGRSKPLHGIREYFTDDYGYVYEIALQQALKYYLKTDIVKIDICVLLEDSKEVQDYIQRRESMGSIS